MDLVVLTPTSLKYSAKRKRIVRLSQSKIEIKICVTFVMQAVNVCLFIKCCDCLDCDWRE